MLRGSQRFDDSIFVSHDVSTQFDIVNAQNNSIVQTLDIVSGNVSADSSRKTRRQCSITVQDPTGDLVPDAIDDYLQPFSGYFFRLRRGISWRDGNVETFPLGTFAPYNPKIDDSGDSLEISLDGYDRSKIISRTRWTQPYTITSGTNTGVAIRALLNSRMANLRFNFTPTNTMVPATTLGTEADNDPWDDATKLAEADGMELFFDANDICVMRPIPDPDADPIVDTYDDSALGTVMKFNRENDADRMYTGVIVYSEGSEVTTPIRVEVWRDDTPLRIPYFFATSLVTTQAQALATAQALLRRVGRAEFTVNMEAIPDPRREVGDVVNIIRPKSKLDDPFVVANVTMPLDASSPMQVGTERRRTRR